MSFDLTSMLSWLFDGYWPDPKPVDDPPIALAGSQRVYTLQQMLAAGETADIYLASSADKLLNRTAYPYILKIAQDSGECPLLDNEHQVLAHLRTAAGKTSYRKYLPMLVESIAPTADFPKRANVFTAEPGWTTLEQVHEQLPALDGRHLGWIFKRFLTVLGFIHRQDRLHGAIFPSHVMLQAAGHGLQLIGWGHCVETGRRLTSMSDRYADWYPPEVQRQQAALPATDLFMAARCLIYLAGGDPMRNRMPDTVPLPMRRFVQSCLLESVPMRPHDAWAVLDDFDDLLRHLYGPPKFHELTLLPSLE